MDWRAFLDTCWEKPPAQIIRPEPVGIRSGVQGEPTRRAVAKAKATQAPREFTYERRQ